MRLLWIILRWLYPNDPVRQCMEAARDRIALMVAEVFNERTLAALASDPRHRMHLEALILDHEAALHCVIGARACQIARLRFIASARRFYTPTRAKPLAVLLGRIGDLAKMCGNLERLAQLRAKQLLREREAGLSAAARDAHGAAALHELVAVSRMSKNQTALMSRSSTCRAEAQRRREDERVPAPARGPPVISRSAISAHPPREATPARTPARALSARLAGGRKTGAPRLPTTRSRLIRHTGLRTPHAAGPI